MILFCSTLLAYTFNMDFQHHHHEGGKTGTGGLLSASESNADRSERLPTEVSVFVNLPLKPLTSPRLISWKTTLAVMGVVCV